MVKNVDSKVYVAIFVEANNIDVSEYFTIDMKIRLSVKISLISVIGMALASTAGIFVTYGVHTTLAGTYAETRVVGAAKNASEPLSQSFLSVENLVRESRAASEIYFPDIDSTAAYDPQSSSVAALRSIFNATSTLAKYVSNYWLVLNPEYCGTTPTDEEGKGFFMVSSDGTNYTNHAVTNITKYDEDNPEDVAHITWWIQAKEGKSTWLKPYYNANTGQSLISYVEPFNDASHNILGVVGVDLDFHNIVTDVMQQHEFQDDHVFLINGDGTVAYHPDLEVFDADGRYIGTQDTYAESMSRREGIRHGENEDVFFYRYRNVDRVSTTVPLGNNMSYGISVARNELYSPFIRASTIPLMIYFFTTIVLGLGLFFLLRYWFRPLQELSKGADSVAHGDLNVKIEKKSDDEIGKLATAFEGMVNALRTERSAMSALAFQDGLTGVKNKNAHKEKVEQLNLEIKEGTARFACVMCDVDELKTINDTRGHAAGDQAIRGACLMICHTFKHSPVYRVGGDEFIAILEGEDYDNREALFLRLSLNNKTDESGLFHFSVGMASYQPGLDGSFADVSERADTAMYLMKRKNKEE